MKAPPPFDSRQNTQAAVVAAMEPISPPDTARTST